MKIKSLIALSLLLLFSVSCEKDIQDPLKPEEVPLRFMVFTDIHFMHPDILKREGNAWKEYNLEECKLLKESPDIFNTAMDSARAVRPDFILVCGDMTKDGEIICHEYVADAFRKLEEETGTKVFVVPGNHDMNNPHSLYYDGDETTPAETADETAFERVYSGFGYSEAVARRDGYLDYMAYPVDGIAVIGVDSNEKNTPEKLFVQGGLSKEQVAWIKEISGKAALDGRKVLLMMHHNLVDFYDNAQLIRGANIANARYEDYNNSELIDDLCDAGIDVVFSGHSHMQSITSASSGGHTVYSVVTSSLVNLPLAFRKGTISRDGTMRLWTSDVLDCRPSTGVELRQEGKRYWSALSGYYMYEAARTVWEYGSLFMPLLGFHNKEELQKFFEDNCKDVFYNFTLLTSNGNEHLVSPKKNVDDAMAAIDNLLNYLEDRHCKSLAGIILKLLVGISIDDLRGDYVRLFQQRVFQLSGRQPGDA